MSAPIPAITPGRRTASPYDAAGALIGEPPLPGDYFFWPTAGWFAIAPDGQSVGLGKHSVVEHLDKTITVSPSILVRSETGTWHGYLERGTWRST